jgi:fructokinase
LRLGVDIGGTKIAVHEILEAEKEAGARCSVGVGMPGFIDPAGLVENAYNTPYNRKPLKGDLEKRLNREVRIANDANCFALSEAVDGAARGARVVFGAILGTGAGGGIVVGERVVEGRHGTAGEWGHVPLPWMTPEEFPGPRCTCWRFGCIEQFVSGPAKNRERDAIGEGAAMQRYVERLARAFAMVINILDPDVIVVGGGMSKHAEIYVEVPPLLARHTYHGEPRTPIVRAAHGDASGVRGAAMLWPPHLPG